MTTGTAEQPQSPQPPVIDVAEVYRTLGRLESAQTQTTSQLARIEQSMTQQFIEINRRIDRQMYMFVGISAAAILGYVLQQVFGR